jgi:predicted dehydrogenase
MVKFGIIGCGNISRFHFNGIEKAGGSVTYIVDINEETARPWIEKTGAKFSKNYMDLINSKDVDVVSILASARFHKEMCLAALEAGKDVVCEKTMANDGEEALEIANAVKGSSQLFFTTYMKRFFPAVVKGKELMPQLGRIISAQVRSYQAWGDFYSTNELGWAEGVTRNYGGAILKCAGSHMLDMTMNFLGRPEYVYAKTDYVDGTDFDRKVTAIMEFAKGITATFETMAHPLSKIGYEKNSWDEKIEINGTNGRIEIYTVMWDSPENNGALLVHYDNETESSTEYRFTPINPFDIEVAEIIKAVENRKQISPDVIDGFNVDVLISAMKESSNKRAAVKLDWRGL